jgi:hypothetical protein
MAGLVVAKLAEGSGPIALAMVALVEIIVVIGNRSVAADQLACEVS